MSVSGIPDSEPGAGPMKVGVDGRHPHRRTLPQPFSLPCGTGMPPARASSIDMSLLDCGLASLSHYVQNYLVSGARTAARQRRLRRHPVAGVHLRRRRDIFVVASTPRQFAGLAGALGRPELTDDPRFATVSARIANRDHVLEVLSAIFATEPREVWVRRLEDADVPCSPVNSMPQVFANPQIVHREMLRHTDTGAVRDSAVPVLRNPIRLSQTPIHGYRRRRPDSAPTPTTYSPTFSAPPPPTSTNSAPPALSEPAYCDSHTSATDRKAFDAHHSLTSHAPARSGTQPWPVPAGSNRRRFWPPARRCTG